MRSLQIADALADLRIIVGCKRPNDDTQWPNEVGTRMWTTNALASLAFEEERIVGAQ